MHLRMHGSYVIMSIAVQGGQPVACWFNQVYYSASKNTDSSVFYTEIEKKILNTDSDPKNTDRDPIIRVIAIQQITVTLR